MSSESGNLGAPRPAVEKTESVESIPNQKILDRITNLRVIYGGLNEVLNFQVLYLKQRLAVFFTPGNEEQGFADAVSLLTEEQCGRLDEQLSLFAHDFVDRQTNENRKADAFDQMAHADAIASIFKELPSNNEEAFQASIGRGRRK